MYGLFKVHSKQETRLVVVNCNHGNFLASFGELASKLKARHVKCAGYRDTLEEILYSLRIELKECPNVTYLLSYADGKQIDGLVARNS